MLEQKRLIAKKYRKDKKYLEALPIYQELWQNKENNWDKWLGWEYAFTLKNLNKIESAIEVSEEVYKKDKDFKYNNDLLCWLLYEKYIKGVTENPSHIEIKNMLQTAEFITNTVKQDGKNTAYENTVFKVVNTLKKLKNLNLDELLRWINKLDYKLLSDDVIIYKSSNDINMELASRKEDFFSLKTWILEKKKDYNECVTWCELALSEIINFHYDNDIWIKVRLFYCAGMSRSNENFEKAIENLRLLSDSKKHWSIYNKIFDCYIRVGEYKKAIIYGAKALLTNDPISMKVTLLCDFGMVLERIGEVELALKHYKLAAHIREENNWKIPSHIKSKLTEYNIVTSTKMSELRERWIEFSRESGIIHYGTIINILPHGKSGFIADESNSTYYFKVSSIIKGKNELTKGKKVSFVEIKSYDLKKQKESKEAIDVVVEK